MKFVFTCGGTAGHINPALAVAGQLRELLPDAEFLFLGAEGMMETELVPREGFEIRTVPIHNLSRSLSMEGLRHNARTAVDLARSMHMARDILKEFNPDIAVGTGGYVCYPVLKSAHRLGIPTLVHESNAVPGLTTKLLSGTVDAVMVGFAHAGENYPRHTRVVYTGTPVRGGFDTLDRQTARARLGLPADKPLLLSVWGSLGSDHMNAVMADFAPLVAQRGDFLLIHSAGKRGYDKLMTAVGDRCGADPAANGVDLRPYIYDMPLVMAAADLITCRSGASTLGELAALGKPALLIPSPNVTNNHQEKNARALEEIGAARVLLEGEFDASSLYRRIRELLEDRAVLEQMSAAMRGSGVPDATRRIVELILDYAK